MRDEAGLYADAADLEKCRADAAEALVLELSAQLAHARADGAAMREAAEMALDAIGNCAAGQYEIDALRAALSGDAGRALLERVEALERDLADKSERCRRGAHALIAFIGAPGPEHIDETCVRAAKHIEALEGVAAAARKYRDTDWDNRWREFNALSNAIDVLEEKQ